MHFSPKLQNISFRSPALMSFCSLNIWQKGGRSVKRFIAKIPQILAYFSYEFFISMAWYATSSRAFKYLNVGVRNFGNTLQEGSILFDHVKKYVFPYKTPNHFTECLCKRFHNQEFYSHANIQILSKLFKRTKITYVQCVFNSPLL